MNIKTYHLFLALALIILFIGIIANESTLDINIHDTYFVISFRDLSFVLFSLYFLSGIGYWLVGEIFKKNLIKTLTIIHTVILIGSFLIYWIIVGFYQISPIKKDSVPLFYDNELENIILVISAILVVFIAQPLYIINLLIGLFRKKNN